MAQRALAESLAAGLAREGYFAPGRAPSLAAALEICRRSRPDLLLVDPSSETEPEARIRAVKRAFPSLPIILLGATPSDSRRQLTWLLAGADGFVSPRASLGALARRIEAVRRGESLAESGSFVYEMFSELARIERGRRRQLVGERFNLTFREEEILALMAERLTNAGIAEKLSLSPHTVKNHVHRILAKMEVTSRWEAVEKARTQGGLPPSPVLKRAKRHSR